MGAVTLHEDGRERGDGPVVRGERAEAVVPLLRRLQGSSLKEPLPSHIHWLVESGHSNQSTVQLILFLGSFSLGFVGLLLAACGLESGDEGGRSSNGSLLFRQF